MARFTLSVKATGRYLGSVESPTSDGAIEGWLAAHRCELAPEDIATVQQSTETDVACHCVRESMEESFCREIDFAVDADRTRFGCWLAGRIRSSANEARQDGRLPETDLVARDATRSILDAGDAFTAIWRQNREGLADLAA
ncbi:MAG: hypothetical protein GF418_15985 [Chitinivibrionales bacterium]|nr:hypothetical protein [Chitinivibrionales bacterium]